MKTELIFTQTKAKMKREKRNKEHYSIQISVFSKLYLQHRHARITIFVANISQRYVQCLTVSFCYWERSIWEKTMEKGGWT